MSKWDRRFLGLANLVATWSKDPSTGVGAVIVDDKHRIVSMGFNGFPRAVRDDDAILENREEKLRRTIHAEANAILFAPRSVEGCTIYVTHPPCAKCAATIIQAGITRVVSRPPWAAFVERWADDIRSAGEMFAESGTAFDYLGVSE